MNVLLAIDGSPYSHRMLSYLAAHDDLLGARHAYTLLTVVSPIPSHAAKFVDASTLRDHYGERANEALHPALAYARQKGWQVEATHEVGRPAEVIAAFADSHQIELVVMGSHGHSALANIALGSVATGVLARCKVPVLLVR